MKTLSTLSPNQLEYAQIAMTLSSLAYDTPSNISTLLLNTNLATKGNWDVVWGPCIKESNLMYLVKNKTSNEYMVTIRGTIMSAWSIFEDVDSFSIVQLPWEIGAYPPMISSGMSDGWDHLNRMVDSTSGLSLYSYLLNIPSNSKIYVTGHSQGAGLASVLAYYLYGAFKGVHTIIPYTFAGETAGIQDFATVYNNSFITGNANEGLRFYNDIDVVPKGFADIASIKQLYGPEPPYVGCPDSYKLLIDGLLVTLPTYVQPANGVALPGPNVPINGTVDLLNRRWYFDTELGIQHNHLTYLYLLGAPLTVGAPSPWPPTHIDPPTAEELKAYKYKS